MMFSDELGLSGIMTLYFPVIFRLPQHIARQANAQAQRRWKAQRNGACERPLQRLVVLR